jgi:outer membrane protein OmpA-like peptidoglycan-associated protein
MRLETANEKIDVRAVARETLKTKLVRTIEEQAEGLPAGSVKIQQTATGVKISVEDLNFNPDSTELLAAEKPKLAVMGRLLAPFRDRMIIFIGHTAQWGTAASCLELSRKRA